MVVDWRNLEVMAAFCSFIQHRHCILTATHERAVRTPEKKKHAPLCCFFLDLSKLSPYLKHVDKYKGFLCSQCRTQVSAHQAQERFTWKTSWLVCQNFYYFRFTHKQYVSHYLWNASKLREILELAWISALLRSTTSVKSLSVASLERHRKRYNMLIPSQPCHLLIVMLTEVKHSIKHITYLIKAYLSSMLIFGKPCHLSRHSGHSFLWEDSHHKARQWRQKLWPQFRVVGFTRMS